MRAVDMLLQRLEVRQARGQHERGLAIEKAGITRHAEQRLGDRREARRPVEPAAAEKRDAVPVFPREDAIAVIFDFVQPRRAVGHMIVEARKLRLDEGRRYLAAAFRFLAAADVLPDRTVFF